MAVLLSSDSGAIYDFRKDTPLIALRMLPAPPLCRQDGDLQFVTQNEQAVPGCPTGACDSGGKIMAENKEAVCC